MQKLAWQNANGDILDLTKKPYGITNWEGFANTSLNIQSQQVPFQDGAVFLDALMEPRELSVTLAIYDGNDLEKRYQYRRELIHTLNPKLGEGYLIYTNDFISKRIKCIAQVPLFPTHNSNDSGTPKASLSWTACDPYWEDLEETIVFADVTKQTIIKNEGDVPVQIKAEFLPTSENGVTNPQLINFYTNKKIKFNGELTYNLVVDTNIGQKKAITKEVNFNYVNTPSAIFNIDYGVDKFVAVGTNFIFYSYDGINFNICEKERNTYRKVRFIKELNIFIICGLNCVYKSNDGIIWDIAYENEQQTNVVFEDVCYFNQKLMVFGSYKTILTSNDGESWNIQEQDFNSNDKYITFAIYKGDLLLLKLTSYQTWNLLKSSDGISFINLYHLPDSSSYYKIASSDEDETIIICGTDTSTIVSNDDGDSWESINVARILQSVCYSKIFKKFYLLTAYGEILYYDKNYAPIYWRLLDSKVPYFLGNYLSGMGESEYLHSMVIMGNIGIVLNSYNGIDFINYSKITSDVRSICYSEEKKLFCLVGKNTIYLGKDVNNITPVKIYESTSDADAYNIRSVIYCSKYNSFIAVCNYSVGPSKNYLLISPDGINWNEIELPFTFEIRTIIYNPYLDLFFMGGNSHLYKSSDVYNWEEVIIPNITIDVINKIAFSESKMVFVGYIVSSDTDTPKVLITSDGINFISKTTQSNSYSDITYVKDLDSFFMVTSSYIDIIKNNDYVHNYVDTESYKNIVYSSRLRCFYVFGTRGSPTTPFIKKSFDGLNWFELDYNVIETYESMCINDAIYFVGYYGLGVISLFDSENVINKISEDSDMNLNLNVGDNRLLVARSSGEFSCNIIFRQKYIGV